MRVFIGHAPWQPERWEEFNPWGVVLLAILAISGATVLMAIWLLIDLVLR